MSIPLARATAPSIYRYASPEDGGRPRVDATQALRSFADDLLESGSSQLALERAFRWGYRDSRGDHVPGLQEQLQELRAQRDRLMRHIEHEAFLQDLQPILDDLDGQEQAPGDDRIPLERLADRLEEGAADPRRQAQLDDLARQLRQMSGHATADSGSGPSHAKSSVSFFDQPGSEGTAAADRVRRMLFSGGVPGAGEAEGSRASGETRIPASVEPDAKLLGELEQLDSAISTLRSIGSVRQLDEADLADVIAIMPASTGEWLGQWSEAMTRFSTSSQVDAAGHRMLPSSVTSVISRDVLKRLFSTTSARVAGEHQSLLRGTAGDSAEATIPWEPGRPLDLDLIGTLSSAIRRGESPGSGRVRLRPDDFLIQERTARTSVSTVLAIDRSRSMGQSGAWTAARKVTLALHELIRQSYPRDELVVATFSSSAEPTDINALPEMQWDRFEHGTHLQAVLQLGRQLLRRTPGGTRQIVVVTDGEPTIASIDGTTVFQSPPAAEVLEATMREVIRCTREHIVINMVLLAGDQGLEGFAEQVARINGGRVFVATTDDLGAFILRDYITH